MNPKLMKAFWRVVWAIITGSGICGLLIFIRFLFFSFADIEKGVFPSKAGATIFFLSLLLSVFCATALYIDFPRSYSYLEFSTIASLLVYIFAPLIQFLFVLFALLFLDKFFVHVSCVLGYFMMFLVWDALIISARHVNDHKQEAIDFQETIRGYFRNIDLPTMITITIMFLVSILYIGKFNKSMDLMEKTMGFEKSTIFMAGVVGSQAVAAFIIFIKRFSEE